MEKYKDLDDIAKEIAESLNTKDVLVYAFNATGKTRLSVLLDENDYDEDDIKSLSYNAIVEDYFSWDNERVTFKIITGTWLFNFINDEGLDGNIIDVFSSFIGTDIKSEIDLTTGEMRFYVTDIDGIKKAIKISKGEERLFQWSVFYSVLKRATELLAEKEEDRSLKVFNQLKYVVIDDPISSLDDYKVYTLSMQILELIKDVHANCQANVKFLLLTHHTLFYNIIFNTLKNRDKDKVVFYFLNKIDEEYELKDVKNNQLAVSHIVMLKEIKRAIQSNNLRKKDFNKFRSVLEKTSIYLGFKKWEDLFEGYKETEAVRKIVNMNSHEKYVEMDTEFLTNEQIQILTNAFNYFVEEYKVQLGE